MKLKPYLLIMFSLMAAYSMSAIAQEYAPPGMTTTPPPGQTAVQGQPQQPPQVFPAPPPQYMGPQAPANQGQQQEQEIVDSGGSLKFGTPEPQSQPVQPQQPQSPVYSNMPQQGAGSQNVAPLGGEPGQQFQQQPQQPTSPPPGTQTVPNAPGSNAPAGQ